MVWRAVLLDFYGTLAESTTFGATWGEILGEYGHVVPDEVRERWWADALDGAEHDEHSRSRDHYVAWQRARMAGLLTDCGVPEAIHGEIIERMRDVGAHQRIEAFDEVGAVLAGLRARGLTLAVCSNWDWDLAEAVAAAGLEGQVDLLVSSAWVGCRKPHPRIYRHTLDAVGVAPGEALFVGDSWGPDVEGPRAMGMAAVYLRRAHREPDPRALADADAAHHVGDLRGLLDLVDGAGGARGNGADHPA